MSNRPRLDFFAIKQAAPIAKVAQLLNLDLKRDTGGFRCPCPSGCGDDRAIKITPGYQNKDGSLGAFYCHGCGKSGDAIGLYAHIREVDNYEAAMAVAKHFGAEERQPAPTSRQPAPESALKPLDHLTMDHEALELLGLSPAICTALGAGFAPKGTMTGRVVIPLRLEDGTLVGYFGLATREDQSPLIALPKNLEERCGIQPSADKPEQKSSPDQLRRLFRLVS